MFIVASVKTTASWVHLRCYSDVILFLFLDQTVPLAILPVVHQDGKCFAYDEIDMFNACKGDTFDLHPPASTTDANDRDPGSASRMVEAGNFLDEFGFHTMAARLSFDDMAVDMMA